MARRFFAGILLIGVVAFFSYTTWTILYSGPQSHGTDIGFLFLQFLFFLFFAVLGTWFLWRAVRPFVQRWIYGPSRLELQTAPVPLGDRLRARLQVALGDGEQPPDGFHFKVNAYIHKDGKNKKHVVQSNETSARGKSQAGQTTVPVSLNLTTRKFVLFEPEEVNWELEVTAEVDGKPDYEVSFDLPVTVPENPEGETAPDTPSASSADTADESVNEEEDDAEREPAAAGEEAYWKVDEDGAETRLHSSESEVPEPVDNQASKEAGSETTRSGPSMTDRIVTLGMSVWFLAPGLLMLFAGNLWGLVIALPGGLLLYMAVKRGYLE